MKWIDPADRLPAPDTPCLVKGEPYGNHGTCYAFAFYDGERWCMADTLFGWLVSDKEPVEDMMADEDDANAVRAWASLGS